MKFSEDQKNMWLAVGLCLIVALFWQYFVLGPKMREEEARQREAASKAAPTATVAGLPAPAALPGSSPAAAPALSGVPASAASREAALKLSPRIAIEAPAITGSISLKGGRIDDLVLKGYHDTVDPKSPLQVLLNPLEAPEPYFVEFGWQPAGATQAAVPGADTLWSPEDQQALSPQHPVVLKADPGVGLSFRRTIAIDDNYLFTITDAVQNSGSAPVRLEPYARVYRIGTPKLDGSSLQHEGLIGAIGANGIQELTYAAALKDKGGLRFDSAAGGWLGFTDKYWAAVVIPDQKATYKAAMTAQKKTGSTPEIFWAEAEEGVREVPAGGSASIETHLFAGAKQVSLIDSYKSKLDILKFDHLVDWGWFYFFAQPLYWLIDKLHGVLGNFGLAILGVTVVVKGIFFPLANKSFESMAKMKKLQPMIEELKTRCGDDKQKLQQETMALYAREKINPLMGCLPLLLQIPVFIALYKVLSVTIDMHHAPFIGWIHDLSAPDPSSVFNLFGLLPWHAPETLLLGHTIGFWPLLMGATMWFSMQLNPQPPDPTQQMVMNWMPAIFIYTMSGLASGLIIYMVWSNILSFTQQVIIMRRQGVELHLWKNLGIEHWFERHKDKETA